ncbi:chromodomain-helicase-DNA-binding protein 4 [Apostasia shenzhenica]|uniref:Chromodomain-helicase-DNA-binding protein 4 n=1 Tax=Apostasia shenzhenica TaxID=1088818 RepID=A0A2H9ZVI2_9ASPA|nr:chromodomain-helicase-DNA-binding protein 4 [Apostasia shenzhenica]
MEGNGMEGAGAIGCDEELKKSGEEERVDQGTEASGSGRMDDIVGGDTGGRGGGLVGAYVVRNSSGIGRVFLGKVVSYDNSSKLYRVMYEDGHQEDLEVESVNRILMEEGAGGKLTRRKRRLDQMVPLGGLKRPNTRSRASISDIPAPASQLNAEDASGDGDSSSDSCDHALVPTAVQDSSSLEIQILPLELPPSSGDIFVPKNSVAYLFSTYNFLRSFSLQLFLSPFGFDDYVGSLNSTVQNSLMDAIHLCLMRALSRQLQVLSSEGFELANKCLTCYDWTLLDVLTWPAFLVEYLCVMGHLKELDLKDCSNGALDGDYYCLPVATKLKVLQVICDDVVNSVELRAELEMRESMKEDGDICLDSNLRLEGELATVQHKSSMTTASMVAGALQESVAFDNRVVSTTVSEISADASTNSQDKNSDECCLCGMDGSLVCCDGCPSAYHFRCIGLNKAFLPSGLWFCPECNVNRLGPTSSRVGRGIRGAEVFGIDPNGRIFMGTCNYLLVFDSLNNESICRYYNLDDVPKVLDAISIEASSFLYIDICRRISEYFEVPLVEMKAEKMEPVMGNSFSFDLAVSNSSSTSPWRIMNLQNSLGYNSMCSTILGNSRNDVPKVDGSEAQVATSIIRQAGISDSEMNLLGLDEVCDNKIPEAAEGILVQTIEENLTSGVAIFEDQKILSSKHINKREQPCFGSSVTDFSISNKPLFAEKSNLLNNVSCSPKNGSDICKEDAVSSIYSTKNFFFVTCESRNISNANVVTHKKTSDKNTHVSFKHIPYINQYTQGDIAASAAARLAILSSEDGKYSEAHGSSNPRKAVSASIALQMKAFSGAVMNFLWPCFDKKVMDVPRERCGWCIACKGMSTNKKGCLLNLAASNAIKGPARNINLRAGKRYEGHLPTIAAHMLIMVESLQGFLIGPFLDVEYSKQWHKQVREAHSFWVLKSLLLELEKNIRGIAFSGGWNKLMDGFSVENPTLSSGMHTAQSEKHVHGSRRSKKTPELLSSEDDGNDVLWWRGGKLSKVVLQIGILPRSLSKKAARQGGRKLISGVPYPGCSSYPRRSRQFAWRAAVELSRTTYQLALQVSQPPCLVLIFFHSFLLVTLLIFSN